MKKIACITILSTGLLCAGEAKAPATIEITKATVSSLYQSYKRLTAKPYRVTPKLAALCSIDSLDFVDGLKRSTGPHFDTSIHLYANAPAADAAAKKLAFFPAGSVIVKEKLTDDGRISGVGGMVKRPAGFDPLNGDWEYFYSDKKAGFTIGKIKSCSECHTEVKAKDYVFRVWDLPK